MFLQVKRQKLEKCLYVWSCQYCYLLPIPYGFYQTAAFWMHYNMFFICFSGLDSALLNNWLRNQYLSPGRNCLYINCFRVCSDPLENCYGTEKLLCKCTAAKVASWVLHSLRVSGSLNHLRYCETEVGLPESMCKHFGCKSEMARPCVCLWNRSPAHGSTGVWPAQRGMFGVEPVFTSSN